MHRRALLGAAGAAALAPVANAQTRWQMATAYADGNLHTRNIRSFIQEIEQASGGRLAVQLHFVTGSAHLRGMAGAVSQEARPDLDDLRASAVVKAWTA